MINNVHHMDALDPNVTLRTERLVLCLPGPTAARALVRFYRENEAHLAPWAPQHPEGFYTELYWEQRLERSRKNYAAGRSANFILFEPGSKDALGTINLSDIIRGPLQGANLGYNLAASAEGRGLMTEALTAVIAHAFGPLNLHRLSAGYKPDNDRSAKVLARQGFRIIGTAKDYLYIAGRWTDHVLTEKTNPDWVGDPVSAA